MSTTLDWGEFYRDLLKNTEWTAAELFSMHPAFWYGITHAGSQKKTFGTFEELEYYIKHVLPPDNEETRLKAARAALRFELDWY